MANNILWAFRKKALDSMVSSYQNKMTSKNFTDVENEIKTKERHKSNIIFRSGDGFRVKWDLLIMTLAVYS